MPLSAFARALLAFRSGDLTHDELSWEIDRQLAIEKTSPTALLEVLKIQQVARPLPHAAHEAIVQHLEDWPDDPTIVTGPSRGQRQEHAPGVDVGDIVQGRFSLVALIGEGGMSRVFKAIDLHRVEAGAVDPYVAVKVLTEPHGEYFGSIVALQRETQKLRSLTHPNIVRVIDCDRDGKTVFMTMEHLAGESLQKKLRAPGACGLSGAAATAIVSTISHALEYAHLNHIVHGDLKPGNIIVTDQGVVKVIDFGMARFIARPNETRPTEPSGMSTPKALTPRYASPEMAAGHDPEPADDVYALACIAYETLCGRHPFGRQSDPRARAPDARPPRPGGMRKQQYAAIVNALAFDRRQRTQTVRQFLAEFLATRREWLLARRAWFALLALVVAGVAGHRVTLARRHHETVAVRTMAAVPGTVIHDCPNCPSMTVLPPGRFEQGVDAAGSVFEKPRHTVVIGRAFAMSTMETTVGEFARFAAATRRDMTGCNIYDGHWRYRESASWEAPGFSQSSTHPVSCVSWDDAVAYAAWLSATGGHHYRLPSASEWEYAARGGSGPALPWGADAAAACAQANVADQTAARRFPGWAVFPCNDNFVNTAPVGSFVANAFGIHDLLGNVFEWVQDCWHDDYVGAPSDGSARFDGGCGEHELRGGSWFTSPQFVSPSHRDRFETGYRSSAVGFRLVRDMDD